MKSNLRFLENLELDVERDGKVVNVRFPFGRWYLVDKLVRLAEDNEYMDVHFANGDVAKGVHCSVLELHGAEVEDEVVVKNEHEDDEDDSEGDVPAFI